MYDPKAVGGNIKALRENARLTQKQMAEIRKTSQSTVAKQETGDRALGGEDLLWYSDYFGVTTDWILGRDEQPDLDANSAAPVTVAAHTDAEMTPALEARINELVKQAIEKYGGKKVEYGEIPLHTDDDAFEIRQIARAKTNDADVDKGLTKNIFKSVDDIMEKGRK